MNTTNLFYDEWTCAFQALCAKFPLADGNVNILGSDKTGDYIEVYSAAGFTRYSSIDEILKAMGWTFQQMEQIAVERK